MVGGAVMGNFEICLNRLDFDGVGACRLFFAEVSWVVTILSACG